MRRSLRLSPESHTRRGESSSHQSCDLTRRPGTATVRAAEIRVACFVNGAEPLGREVSEELPYVVSEKFRLLERSDVSAAWHFGPALDVVGALGELAHVLQKGGTRGGFTGYRAWRSCSTRCLSARLNASYPPAPFFVLPLATATSAPETRSPWLRRVVPSPLVVSTKKCSPSKIPWNPSLPSHRSSSLGVATSN